MHMQPQEPMARRWPPCLVPREQAMAHRRLAGHRPAPLLIGGVQSGIVPEGLGDRDGMGDEDSHGSAVGSGRCPPTRKVVAKRQLHRLRSPLLRKPMRRASTGAERKVHGRVHDRTEPA